MLLTYPRGADRDVCAIEDPLRSTWPTKQDYHSDCDLAMRQCSLKLLACR